MASASKTASKTAPDTASVTANFFIFHRDKEGKPDRIFSYDDEEARYLLVGINIARELLNHIEVRGSFADVAKIYIAANPSCLFRKSEPATVAARYVNYIYDAFPWSFLDEGFRNPNIAACHFRRTLDRFFTRNQAICLNAPVR